MSEPVKKEEPAKGDVELPEDQLEKATGGLSIKSSTALRSRRTGRASAGEKPHTRVWGDPHITEKD